MIHGMDYFSGNGEPSFGDSTFVFRKITEGIKYVDPGWVSSWDRIKHAGKVRGGYHFFHHETSWEDQAIHFLDTVRGHIGPGDLIALDYENGQNTAGKNSWLSYVKRHYPNNKVGLYAPISMWHGTDSNCGDFLWIADPSHPAGKPAILSKWFFHQYSSSGDIDHDVANFASVADLKHWAGSPISESSMSALELDTQVPIPLWLKDAYPKDAGLKDGHMEVQTLMASGYAHARVTHDLLNGLIKTVAALEAKVEALKNS